MLSSSNDPRVDKKRRYDDREHACDLRSFCKARYTLATKSKGRSTFGRQKLPTFDKVDRVEHVQLWRQCRPRHGRQSRTSRRQSTFDKPTTDRRQRQQSTLSPLLLTVDFVASVYRALHELLRQSYCISTEWTKVNWTSAVSFVAVKHVLENVANFGR